MWRAYNVGPGRFLWYAELSIEKQGDTSLKIIQPFGPRTKQRGTVMESTRPTAEIFSCSESACVLTFKTEAEADAHMDSGKHIRELESESLYDNIRKKWAEKVTGVSLVSHVREPNAIPEVQTSSSSINSRRSPGWALKTTKKPARMEVHVKVNLVLLVQKFDAGARSKLKADPIQVSHEVKFAKDANGHSLFKPEEWRAEQRISSFFSRLSAMQRQRQTKEVENHYEEVQEEDLEALESEIFLESLRNTVLHDISTPYHPIKVGSRNVCELSRTTLKVAELRKKSEILQLAVDRPPSRKKSFIKPLETYAKTCTCLKILKRCS